MAGTVTVRAATRAGRFVRGYTRSGTVLRKARGQITDLRPFGNSRTSGLKLFSRSRKSAVERWDISPTSYIGKRYSGRSLERIGPSTFVGTGAQRGPFFNTRSTLHTNVTKASVARYARLYRRGASF